MQTTAIRTVANSLPENEVILLTLLISKRYIPYTHLQKIPQFPQLIHLEPHLANNRCGVFLIFRCNTQKHSRLSVNGKISKKLHPYFSACTACYNPIVYFSWLRVFFPTV